MEVQIPCGRCIGCRLKKSAEWAIRCHYEISEHENNCFITLTYDNDHLPSDQSLNKEHFQKFIKRLRKKTGQKIRYFHCGEYGSKLNRPHYHAILFGFDFNDKKLWTSKNGNLVYTSDILADTWGAGHCSIGDANFTTAAYIARYCTKKIYGEESHDHYASHDLYDLTDTGEKTPEYATMSLKPAIGLNWLEKYWSDLYPLDKVLIDGKTFKPPKYFDRWMEENQPEIFNKVKYQRHNFYADNEENKFWRLSVKEKSKLIDMKDFKRSFEDD